jgi:hypothetical protein
MSAAAPGTLAAPTQQPSPAPQSQPQPPAPAYIVAGPGPGKRVRLIDARGVEEHADDNPWVHMRLNDGSTEQQVERRKGGQARG